MISNINLAEILSELMKKNDEANLIYDQGINLYPKNFDAYHFKGIFDNHILIIS